MPSAFEVPFASLVILRELQPRTTGLDPEHVAALKESIEYFPPITVIERDGQLVLVDGQHRVAAAQELGLTRISARIIASPEDGDLHSLAFTLNALHGRPLTLPDRRAEAARLLRASPVTSDNEIAQHCSLAQPTVGKIRAALEAGAQIEQTTSRVGRGGYRYEIRPREPDSGPEAERRRLARYLVRLATTLERSNDYPAWTDAEAAAGALLEFSGEDEAPEIVEMLGRNASDVLALAAFLGWEPKEEAS
jgi:ParB-like chromosome segregation protein Spo0J